LPASAPALVVPAQAHSVSQQRAQDCRIETGGVRHADERSIHADLAFHANNGIIPMPHAAQPKPLVWIGSSRKDMESFPEDVQDLFGYALYVAQMGGKHPDAKPLKGFGGAGVLEIVDDYKGGTYRAVYTVRLSEAVYALHAYQKKSTTGIATRREDVDLIRQRLRQALEIHRQGYGK